jgi:8-oxo-dGTP diphosphatase
MKERIPAVGVGCIISRANGDLLLVRRQGAHGAGSWSTPGGYLEFGESPAECAKREAKEETGVTVASVRFHAVTNDLYPEEGRHFVTLWMVGQYADGEPVPSDEASAVAWFPRTKLPSPLFTSFQNLINEHGLPSNETVQPTEHLTR